MTTIILATASKYKYLQMQQLQLPFICLAADVDETPLASESAKYTAIRLAKMKAKAIADKHPDAVVIGCDQTANIGEHRLDKPLSKTAAIDQLTRCSGKTATFYSSVCVLHALNGTEISETSETNATFRDLDSNEIAIYAEKENALNCAGGFKVESLGISLFESVSSNDPSALIGMPLIALCRLLRSVGINPLST